MVPPYQISDWYTDTDTLFKLKQQACMNRQLTIQRHCIANKRKEKKEKKHTQLQTKDGAAIPAIPLPVPLDSVLYSLEDHAMS